MSIKINANPFTHTVRLFSSTGSLVAVGNLNPAKQGLLATRNLSHRTATGKKNCTSSVRITGGAIQFFDDSTIEELIRRMLRCYEDYLRQEMIETRLLLYPEMKSADWRVHIRRFVDDDVLKDD